MSTTDHVSSTRRSAHGRTKEEVSSTRALVRTSRSELVKLGALRSQLWLLGLGSMVTAVLGPLQAVGEVVGGGSRAASEASISVALAGVSTSSLILGVLGVLLVAGEYSPRAIRTTFTLTPRRHRVVVGKAVALAVSVAVTSILALALAIPVTQVVLSRAGGHSSAGYLPSVRVVLGAVLLLVGWGVLGQVAGWLTRSKLGGASLLLVVMVVLDPVLTLVPGSWADTIGQLTPAAVGQAMVSLRAGAGLGSPAAGFVIWTTYLAVTVWFAARLTAHRDA